MKFLIFALVAAFCALSVSATLQTITIKGVAMCHKKPVPNAKVQLYERDIVDPNDLLAEVITKEDGSFVISGQEDEVGTIEPFITIIHNCMTSQPNCDRHSDYTAPQHKIGGVYDMKDVTLDIKVDSEKEVCH